MTALARLVRDLAEQLRVGVAHRNTLWDAYWAIKDPAPTVPIPSEFPTKDRERALWYLRRCQAVQSTSAMRPLIRLAIVALEGQDAPEAESSERTTDGA